MARKPFFSGNYGSALARVDTRPIVEAGRAQGQMFANLGSQIGGMIKQYGLNKEKRQKEEDTAMGNLANFSPEDLLALETTSPKLAQAIKRATTEQATPRDFQTINAGTATFIAAKGRERDARLQESIITGNQFKNDLNEATQENQIAMSGLELAAKNLSNKKSELEKSLLTIKSETERDRVRGQLDLLNEQIEAQKTSNKFLRETEGDRRLQSQLKSATLVQSLAKGASEIAALEKKIETMGQLTPLEAQRLATLKSEAEKNLAEADNLRKQSEQLQSVLDATKSSPEGTDEPAVQLDNINQSAQGDIAGQVKGGLNTIAGYLFGKTPFKGDKEGAAQVEIINQQFRPAFVKALSDKGSVYTQQEINKILPQVTDDDGTFRAKITKLPALLRRQIKADEKTLVAGIGTKSQRAQAFDNIQKLPALASSLEEIIKRDEEQQSGPATTKDELLNRFRR